MRIDIDAYKEHYHNKKNGKLVDNWQEGIKILPFTSNPTSAVDKGSGLAGATGGFFRLIEDNSVKAIENFSETVAIVENYLKEDRRMSESKAQEFSAILRDIMVVNGALNVTDISFLKYIPLVPADDNISDKNRKKYKAGQTKLANYLFSMLSKKTKFNVPESKNIFTQLLRDALANNETGIGGKLQSDENFYVLPFIKKTFNHDLSWMMEQDPTSIVRYIHLLLHFYACYAVLQAIPKLNPKCDDSAKLTEFYFILNSERASVTHDAVCCWKEKMPKNVMDKIFGKSQALDIINCVLGGNVGFYTEVIGKLNETPFAENKEACEELLRLYQEEKRFVFSKRNSEDGSIDEIDTTVSSYENFIEKLDTLCRGLQSPSYVSRMRKKVTDLLGMRFLQLRRGNYVLVLDNEMLVFLIAMVTKSQRTKLEDMYKRFNSYGIFFNRGTRKAIEDYLLKLNLLDRKSDSGEAQYVKVIL